MTHPRSVLDCRGLAPPWTKIQGNASARRFGIILARMAKAASSRRSPRSPRDRVLVRVDTEDAHDQLVNSPLAYVSVSRRRYYAHVCTNDAGKLGGELSRDASKQAALEIIGWHRYPCPCRQVLRTSLGPQLSRPKFQKGESPGGYTQSNVCTTHPLTGVQALSSLHSMGRRVCLRFVRSRCSDRADPPSLRPSGGGAGPRNEAGGRWDGSACVVWRLYSYASLRCFTAYTKMTAPSSRNRIR